MVRPLHAEVRHLPLHHPGIGAQTAGTEALEEDLACSLRMRGVKILRGENPGGTPSSGAPPGGCG